MRPSSGRTELRFICTNHFMVEPRGDNVEQLEVAAHLTQAPSIARRDRKRIARADFEAAAVLEAGASVEDEAEHQLSLVRRDGDC